MKIKRIAVLFVFIFITIGAHCQKLKLLTSISKDLPTSYIEISPNKLITAVADDTTDPLGFKDVKEDFKITIRNASNFEIQHTLSGHSESIESLDFSSDSEKLVSADKSGLIIIWNLKSGKKIAEIKTDDWVHDAKFTSSDNEIVAIQGYEKRAFLISITGETLATFKVDKQINDFDINKKTNLIYFGCYDEFQIWSLISRSKISSKSFSGLMRMSFDNSFNQLAIGLSSGDILLLDKELNEVKRFSGHFKPVLSMDFNFNNSKLISGSSDQTARIWDIAKGKELKNIVNAHKGDIKAVCFISSKDEIMTGGESKELKLWK